MRGIFALQQQQRQQLATGAASGPGVGTSGIFALQQQQQLAPGVASVPDPQYPQQQQQQVPPASTSGFYLPLLSQQASVREDIPAWEDGQMNWLVHVRALMLRQAS